MQHTQTASCSRQVCWLPLSSITPRVDHAFGQEESRSIMELTASIQRGGQQRPITVQPLVAAALDTARRAGLCVTDSNLMTPRKSVTALLGVSDHPVRGHLAGCGHCVLRTRCEYRKRGITCASE